MPLKSNDSYSTMHQYNEIILGDGTGANGGAPRCGVLAMTPGPGANQADGVGGASATFSGSTLTVTANGSTYSTCGINTNSSTTSVGTLTINGTFSPGSQMIIELVHTGGGQVTVDPTAPITFGGTAVSGSTLKYLDGATQVQTSANGHSILITLYRGCGPNNGGSTSDYTYITANLYVS